MKEAIKRSYLKPKIIKENHSFFLKKKRLKAFLNNNKNEI